MVNSYKEIVNFIRKLYNQPKGFIPLHAPVFEGNEKKYLEECIDTTFVSSVGKFVDHFEIRIAEYTGAKKAVACVNGTNALHIALMMVGVERNTEVITQSLTFIATANAISYCGAKHVFLDVDMDTMGLSPTALKKWLKNSTSQLLNPSSSKHECFNKKTGKRISACIPMHTFGHPAKIDEIVEICNEFNIPVVEDAAESLGSFYSPHGIVTKNDSGVVKASISRGKGQHTGTFGKIGLLSFNGNKIITTGGGGMLLFNDEELGEKAKYITTQAKVSHPWEFVHDEIGYNYRMPNINAAIGLAQLELLPYILESKRQTAKDYKKFFEQNKTLCVSQDSQSIEFISEPAFSSANHWLNCILFPNKQERDAFLKYSNEKGVMTRPAWKLMNELEMFRDSETDALENSIYIADRLVNIPSSVILSYDQ